MRITPSTLSFTVLFAFIGCQQEPESPSSTEAGSSIATASSAIAEQHTEAVATQTKQSAGVIHGGGEASSQPSQGETLSAVSENHQVDQPAVHGPGRGMGRGFRGDMTTIHAMFAGREKITRAVKLLPNGAEALTESDDKTIAELIQEHVPAVETRVIENSPLPPMTFHPIFIELIKHSEDYALTYDETAKGMKVTYTASDPYVVMLVQEHAKLVSRFLKNGMSEIHKTYEFPNLDGD